MRLDPRTKLLILAVTSVSVFMNKSIAVECVLAGIPLVLLSVSGNLKRMLKYAAFFLALLLIQLFIVPRLPVTFGGIVYMFAVYIRKLLPCFMLGSFLIATTSVSKFLAAITKLRLSKGLTIALAVTLRYFPTMREEWASIRDAMALRGISASAAGLISHPIQTMEHVYVPLLVSASRISDEITEELHLSELRGRNIFELSGGEKQKIAFSSVYASAPDVLVFDEPSSNLDMKAIGELADLIQQAKISGKTILIAEHRIWYLMDIVDRVVYMQDGRIASDMEASAFKALPEADIRRMGLRVRDLSVSESGGVKTIAADGLLSAQKISVRLGGRNVLNDISFQASRGEIIAIAGVNGAGKSTLARMLCGLQKNGSGTVLWTGKPMSRRLRRKKAYMVMQDVGHQLFTDSVAAECALGIKAPNKDEIDRTLEKVDLLAYKERHPLSLSGGQMQRLAVVVSDICGKELLVFDEPTSGLDLKSMEEVGILTRSLATQGKVLLIITHDIEFMMRICTRILFIRDGEIMKDLSGGQKEKIVRLLRGEE